MEPSAKISINISNLTKRYQKKYGIKDVSTSFEQGHLNILVGENGSGKSTLLKCIMGLVNYEGNIIKKKYRIGYAPEDYVMPEFMTVIEFLRNIGRIKGINNFMFDILFENYLKLFDLYDQRNKPIKTLSNGMKQKVNLLQAIIHEPKILILDEPLVSLDEYSQKHLVRLINERYKTTLIIISTHRPEKFKNRKKKLFKMIHGKLVEDEIS